MQYRQRYFEESGGAPPILALGLSSRKNLCIHPKVVGEWPGRQGPWQRRHQVHARKSGSAG